MKPAKFKHGDQVILTVSFEAEIVSVLDEVKRDDLIDMVLRDDAYGLKSIIVGKLSKDCDDDHDTEILLNSTTVCIELAKEKEGK